MKIYIRNAEEYVAVNLGLCGEVEQELLLPRAPLAPASVYRAIKNLRDRRVLLVHRYDDGRKFLRLSSVSAAAYLSQISPALSANAKTVVNEKLQYAGSKQVRLRERGNFELHLAFVDAGIPINGIETEYRPAGLFKRESLNTEGSTIFTKDGAPLSFEEISESLPDNYTGLFTRRVVKERENGEITHKSSRNSRITGTLFINGQMYQTYALQDPYFSSWQVEAESNAMGYITGTFERRNPRYRDIGLRMEARCILFYPAAENAERMLLQERVPRTDPCRIYEASIIRPSYRMEKPLKKLLGTPEWRVRLTDILFPGGAHDGISDVTTDDGTEIYNFIGCDLNRIRFTTKRIQSMEQKAVLLIEPWMEGSIHKIFEREGIEIITINEEDMTVLADSI